jgi:hypothetical protein
MPVAGIRLRAIVQRGQAPAMNSSTDWRASSSRYWTGGDFMK